MPEVTMDVYDFRLVGEMPLLMCADDIEKSDEVGAWQTDPKNKNVSTKGDDRSPPWRWTTYAYTDGEHFAMPSDNIMACLRGAGAKMSIRGMRGTLKRQTQSGLIPVDEYCLFTVGGNQIPESILDEVKDQGMTFVEQKKYIERFGFKLWPKRAKVGNAKHIRVRPRFETWEVAGAVRVVAPEFTEERMRELFVLAGREGLCDWRPSAPKSPGAFGMFVSEISKRK